MRRRFFIGFALVVALLAMLVPGMASANTPVSGAVFTTVNPDIDRTGHCLNGGKGAGAGLVNCNIYDGKQYVWLSGGPDGHEAALVDGTYFFAVLVPGGQGSPNDGTEENLSDLSPTSSTGAGDAWTNRVFTVSNGVISYSGTHTFDNAHTQSQYGKIRLMPYDDTTNPGGEYILAVCNLADATDLNSQTANPPGVDPSDCKYDAFKVKTGDTFPAKDLTIDKTAIPSYDQAYTWTIIKNADNTTIKQSGNDATVIYSVVVSHDSGTPGNWKVTGKITVSNSNSFDVAGVDVTDAVNNGGDCVVANGADITVPGKGSVVLDYICTYNHTPDPWAGTNTATATWFEGLDKHVSVDKDFDFTNATVTSIDDCVTVVDDNFTPSDTSDDTALGSVCVGNANPTTFTYQRTVTGTAGTCTTFDNTASFETNTTKTTGSDGAEVKLCVGADLTVNKTATPSFTRTYAWDIKKSVDKTLVRSSAGTAATFNYTVNVNETGFTDSGWGVTGKITVSNPNDWEEITADLSDSLPGCALNAASVTVPASSSVPVGYSCSFSSGASGTNTATATWDSATSFTPGSSASGSADFAFTTPTTTVNKTITVNDTFKGNLGTLTATDDAAHFASATYTYPRIVTIQSNLCTVYNNTATIVETGQSDSKTVTACSTLTGGLTIGFWQNKNGQAKITGDGYALVSGVKVCNLTPYLRNYAPFQDLTANATCAQVGTYVTNVIKAANASGAAMNAMLKAQMLATALDVYFNGIGGVKIDLTQVCKMVDSSSTGMATCLAGSARNVSAAFGGAASMKISDMLNFAASQFDPITKKWYGDVKATQELAKDAFDAINNNTALIAP